MDTEASSKKSRKPYTLTKARESWSNDEHERFIKALQLYNRDWKKIETYVGTKTVVQIRSHAQKYFQKIMKFGITDAIPPPRPKKRASDPPHGAPSHSDAKHMRLLSDAPSRQGSGKDEDSDEGVQVHYIQHAGHPAQQQQHQHNAHHRQHTEILEPSAQLEAARALITSQGLQHAYLFLASMFSQQQVDLPGMLQRLSMRDRCVLEALLKSLTEELAHQQHSHQHSDQQQHHSQHVQLPEDDNQQDDHQQDGHHQQEQQHLSGSGGQSNGANGTTVNTTAGTTMAADAPAAGQAAAVEQAGNANLSAGPTASSAAAVTAAPAAAAAGGPSARADDSADFAAGSAAAEHLQHCNGGQQQAEDEHQVPLLGEQPVPQQQLPLQERQRRADLLPDSPQQQQQAQVDGEVAASTHVQPLSGSSPRFNSPAAGLQEDDLLTSGAAAAGQVASPAAG